MKELPSNSAEQRNIIDGLVANKGVEKLYEEIIAKDSQYQKILSKGDLQRIRRVYSLLFFYNISYTKYAALPNVSKYKAEDFLKIYIKPDREILYKNINARVDVMINQGAAVEVSELLKKNYSNKSNIFKAIGIKELQDAVSVRNKEVNFMQESEMLGRNKSISDMMKKNTRNYAKRQITFFNNQIKSDLIVSNYKN